MIKCFVDARRHFDEVTTVKMVLPLQLEHPFNPIGEIRQTSPCGRLCDDKNIRHIEFESNNVIRRLRQINYLANIFSRLHATL